jgi:hypothetical protein
MMSAPENRKGRQGQQGQQGPGWGFLLLVSWSWFFWAGPAAARTIVITDEDCDHMAAISADAPLLSWAPVESEAGVYTTFVFQLTPRRGILLQFPLEKIPRGQRVTSAELVIPVDYVGGASRLEVRRLLASWGAGVCYKYRQASPKKVKWAKPGARGVSTDVALKPTAVTKVTEAATKTVNVTADVELWYTRGAVNRGWILTLKDEGGLVQMTSPLSPFTAGKGKWKLRVTYEPKD